MKTEHGLFTNKKDKTGEIFLYDQIGEDRWFGGGITAKAFAKELRDLGDVDSIDLRVNSPGGDVFEADAIYNLLVQHKAPVNVFIDGLAASAASYIAMAGDTIRIAENAKFMVHNPRGGLVVFDEASAIREEATKLSALLDKIRDSMLIVYGRRTQKDSAELTGILDAETWYVGKEAVDAGFASEMIPAKTVDAYFPMLAKFKNVPDSLKEQKQKAAEMALDSIAAVNIAVEEDEAAERATLQERFRLLAQVSPYWRERNEALRRKYL